MDLANIMKQAKELQEKMQRIQEELVNMQVVGEAGAGLVRVIMTGRYQVKKVVVDPSLLANKTMLEELIAGAVNDASAKVETETQGKMAGLASGMQLPAGLNPGEIQ
jgi:DNA-binding YbaB/EbfC family protein